MNSKRKRDHHRRKENKEVNASPRILATAFPIPHDRRPNPLFKRGNWHFKINEVPNVTFTLKDRTKKEAIEAAFVVAPGCTFQVAEAVAV